MPGRNVSKTCGVFPCSGAAHGKEDGTASESSHQCSCYCQRWQNYIAATATVAGFQRNCSVYKDVLHSQTENLPSSPLWLQTKAAHTKSTPCRSTQWKADAAVLRALENFLIKSWCLCSSALNNQQRIEALSGDDTALDTVTAKSCLQMCYPNTETHVTVC